MLAIVYPTTFPPLTPLLLSPVMCTWIWQCHVNLIKLNEWRRGGETKNIKQREVFVFEWRLQSGDPIEWARLKQWKQQKKRHRKMKWKLISFKIKFKGDSFLRSELRLDGPQIGCDFEGYWKPFDSSSHSRTKGVGGWDGETKRRRRKFNRTAQITLAVILSSFSLSLRPFASILSFDWRLWVIDWQFSSGNCVTDRRVGWVDFLRIFLPVTAESFFGFTRCSSGNISGTSCWSNYGAVCVSRDAVRSQWKRRDRRTRKIN